MKPELLDFCTTNLLRITCYLGVVIIGLTCGTNAEAQSWSGLRGDTGVGSAKVNGILSNQQNVRLRVKWKRTLGSGYSSPVLYGDRLIAMYSDPVENDGAGTASSKGSEASDWVGCFDASNGNEIWKARLGEKFVGKNGSFDGPLSTPLIHDGFVYALSPRGKFIALSLEDGDETWTRDLVKEESATQPLYGFTTSPIVAGGNIVLQVGAKEKALAAFDPRTGETIWTVGSDSINSQTPIRTIINGQELVLAAGGKYLMGVDAISGKSMFEYEHQGGNGSAMVPVPIGDDSFLLTLDDRFSKAIQVRPLDNAFHASEIWQQPSIKNTYNVPVVWGDHLFAFSTRILTCVDRTTGKALWRNRKPGDGFLIVVDGHLVIATKKGGLHLAKASADGYKEMHHLQLFKDLVWSIPAFSRDQIYCRSLGELACVELTSQTSIVQNSVNSPAVNQKGWQGAAPILDGMASPKLKRFAASLENLDAAERTAAVSSFIEANSPMPIVEGELVTFVYASKSQDVAVASDIFGARQERKMTPLPNSNLHYLTAKLPPDQRANYCFLVDYQPVLDPHNADRQVTSTVYAGEMEFAVRLADQPPLKMSWFGMPGWKKKPYLDSKGNPAIAEARRGQLQKRVIDLEEGQFSYEVYLPPGYDSNDVNAEGRKFPVIYLFGGPAAKTHGDFVNCADRFLSVTEHSETAALVVLLNSRDPGFRSAFPKQVISDVDKTYRTYAQRQGRVLVGHGFEGAGPLLTLAENGDTFGGASVHSGLLFDDAQDAAVGGLSRIEQPTTVRVEWGRYDMFNPHENWDIRTISSAMVSRLKRNPKLNVVAREVSDTTDWSSWRNRYDELFHFSHQLIENSKNR